MPVLSIELSSTPPQEHTDDLHVLAAEEQRAHESEWTHQNLTTGKMSIWEAETTIREFEEPVKLKRQSKPDEPLAVKASLDLFNR